MGGTQMGRWSRYFAGGAILVGLFALGGSLSAETAELTYREFEVVEPGEPDPDARFREAMGRSFYFQCSADSSSYSMEKVRMYFDSVTEEVPTFDEVISKDRDDYVVSLVCRGVVQLGEGYYGYVLDKGPVENSEATAFTPNGSEETTEPFTYSRLYIDLDHDGDLTDEEPIDAEPNLLMGGGANCVFPAISLRLKVGDEEFESAFTTTTWTSINQYSISVDVSLNPAGCLEGDIELAGENRRVVLIDYNGNGRYDDKAKLNPMAEEEGLLFPEPGDMLFIDPQPVQANLFNPLGGDDQFILSDLFLYEDKIYDIAISPSGRKLEIASTDSPLGIVENPNGPYSLAVWGDHGMLSISADANGRATIPAGQWRMMYYMLNRAPEQESDEVTTSMDEMMQSMTVFIGMPKADAPPFVVKENETLQLPFGGPFRPVVAIEEGGSREQGSVELGMTLTGVAGETCQALMISGEQPPPEFTITTPEGEFVASGVFEYG
jgi:hypothetical protein